MNLKKIKGNFLIKIFSLNLFLALLLLVFSFESTLAQTPGAGLAPSVIKLENPLNASSFPAFLSGILNTIVDISLPILVLAIIYDGYLFVMSQGNPEKIEKAKQAITWTLLGAALVLGAFVIARVITGTFNNIKKAGYQQNYEIKITELS